MSIYFFFVRSLRIAVLPSMPQSIHLTHSLDDGSLQFILVKLKKNGVVLTGKPEKYFHGKEQ